MLGKGCKVVFCPLRAASLLILEAGTVAFFSLGCRGANETPALDTRLDYQSRNR
jgi:hypothetical protein